PARITRQPYAKVADLKNNVIFEVEVHAWGDTLMNDPPLFSPEYQWYKAGTPPVKLQDNSHYSGTKSNVLGIRNVAETDYAGYYVTVRSQCNNDTSDVATLSPYPSVNIATQPADVTKCEGEDAQFTIDATITGGTGELKYQWFQNGTAINDNTVYTGTQTNTLTVTGATVANAGQYKCTATVVPGDKNATSSEATLTVNVKPTITTQPVATLTDTVGVSIELSVAATGTATLQYQWYKDNTIIDGSTTSTLTIAVAKVEDSGKYYCIVKNACGEVKSNESTVSITTGGVVGVDETNANGFELNQNTPNPFGGSTEITFVTPTATSVRIVVTDIFGKEIVELVNRTVEAGSHSVKLNAQDFKLSTGVYYYTMTADGYSITKKMLVVK
ncbi:MAG: immunoglobulin domain-containing protein, partial [Bacteroidota bacterium]